MTSLILPCAPRPRRPRRAPVLLAAFAIALAAPTHAQTTASFSVRAERAPDAPEGVLPAVTVTIGALSEGSVDLTPRGGAMEPAILRDWFEVLSGTPTSLDGPRDALSLGGNLREGALDGAEVDIYRLENGRFRSIRTARVAPGGHHLSGWERLFWKGNAVPADSTVFRMPIPRGWRAGADLHVGLQAMDRTGRPSPITTVGPIVVPAQEDRAPGRREGKLVRLRGDIVENAPESNLLGAPKGLRAAFRDGQLEIRWDGPGLVAGLATQGFVPLISFVPPDSAPVSRLVLETEGPAPQAGDLAVVRASFTNFDRSRVIADSDWGQPRSALQSGTVLPDRSPDGSPETWRLLPHEGGDTPARAPGTHYLSASVTQDSPLRLFNYTFGPSDGTWRPPLRAHEIYEASVWLRAPEGDVTVSLSLPSTMGLLDADTETPLTRREFDVTRDWQRHSVRFLTRSAISTRPEGLELIVTGTGRIDIDDFFQTTVDTRPGFAAPRIVQELRESGMGALRLHALVRTKQHTYDLAQLLGTPVGQMSETGVGLPAFLQAAQAAGMAPWLQIEPHLSGAEWRGLVEYLAAPWDAASDSAATKPWSALRVAQGREAPWTDAFDRILLELGNEMWNGLFSPWTAMPIADAATGLILPRSEMLGAWQAHVMAEMAQSPYWEGLAPHIETVIGGWARHPGFGAQAAAAAARAGAPVDHVGIAAYVGGWDEGEGVVTRSPFSYATVLANPVQVGAPVTARHKAELARLAGEGLPVPSLITYEGGPGYVLDGLNRRTVSPEETLVQEQVMKSQAAGTATLDTVLTRALGGTLSQNFFGYGRGSHWKSHAMLWAGGHAYPSWEWLEVFNHHLRGELLQVDTLNAPTVDLPAQARREALPDAPLIAVHAMRNGDRLSVVAVSRQVPGATGVRGDGSAEVTIDLPIQGAAMLTEWSMTGDYDTHDVGEDRVRPVSRRIELSQDQTRLRVSLPAGVIRAYVLDGVRWEQRTLERHAD